MTDSTIITAKSEAFKLTNALVELSKIMSERVWEDETNSDKFILGALADSIHSAADELHDLVQVL